MLWPGRQDWMCGTARVCTPVQVKPSSVLSVPVTGGQLPVQMEIHLGHNEDTADPITQATFMWSAWCSLASPYVRICTGSEEKTSKPLGNALDQDFNLCFWTGCFLLLVKKKKIQQTSKSSMTKLYQNSKTRVMVCYKTPPNPQSALKCRKMRFCPKIHLTSDFTVLPERF